MNRAIFQRVWKKIPSEDLQNLAAQYGLSKPDDLFAAVGFGKYSARQVLSRYFGEPVKEDGLRRMPSPRWLKPSSACWGFR